MRFALLGDHPDGVDMACALAESGRHRLVVCTTPLSEDELRRLGEEVRRVSDVEEVLADPAVDAVIVAGRAGVRPAQLRRALQSERHVLCVHPPDQSPEISYEAAMIRNDTGCVLLPLLPEATHPAIRRLAEFVRRKDADNSPIGAFRLLEMERESEGEVLDGVEIAGHKHSFPGWDILRTLGGEIQEVWAFAEQEELREGEPVLVAGRFERGGLFHVRLLPRAHQPRWRLTAIGSRGMAELLFPLGWNGPAILEWRDAEGEAHEEYWQRWDPWPVLIDAFEQALALADLSKAVHAMNSPEMSEIIEQVQRFHEDKNAFQIDEPELNEIFEQQSQQTPNSIPHLSWKDAIRALELDDAARRAVEKRRSSLLEYQEATEEVGFKGTMTLVGCSLLWGVLLLLILSVWWPKLGFLIVPLIMVFLGLQLLRYIVPSVKDASQKRPPDTSAKRP
jgi:predicted dehydrogenase